ncbi:MAG: DUF1997 domain-containing protein [Acaryochloridaceae cyanobacterium SU_2_1]|nr:DUF1997 domain-containing protein [Acaryochloridaceae cyanobacterium SU_2_1]
MQLSNTQYDIEDQLLTIGDDSCAYPTESASGLVQFVCTQDLSAEEAEGSQFIDFRHQFTGHMALKGDSQTVMQYLDAHQGWFCRCAQPMQVEPVSSHGYILSLGRYGSFGFYVEPQIGLHLLPQAEGVYRIETIPVPEQVTPPYQVDFQAALQLLDDSPNQSSETVNHTSVEWNLDLKVAISFPQFILRLPRKVIQGAGDQVLKQIVRQISHRLTQKVQSDFHATYCAESV